MVERKKEKTKDFFIGLGLFQIIFPCILEKKVLQNLWKSNQTTYRE